MSKEIIDHGFGVIETRETFYTEETIRQKDQQISDLEAKLAESERQYQEYRQVVEKEIEKEIDERIRDTIKEFNLDISQLKQQLAEKDKQIETARTVRQWRIDSLEWDKKICEEHKQVIFNQLLEKCKKANQDKISFCIEKLEKLKESVLKIDKTEIKTLDNGYSTLYIDRPEVITKIDNQIKQLKGEK